MSEMPRSIFPWQLSLVYPKHSGSLLMILVLTGCLVSQCFATVDYLAVNKITKEIYTFDEEKVRGIGWVPIGEQEEADYLALGFTHTKYPYVLDNVMTWMVTAVTVIALLLLWRRNLIRKNLLIILFYLHLVHAIKYVAFYSYRSPFGMQVTVLMFIIPMLILMISWMIENFKVQQHSVLKVVCIAVFSFLLFIQMWMH